jgi:hypothetical protein
MIREAFGDPTRVSESTNKLPKVTVLLLRHLLQIVPDTEVRIQLQEMIDYVTRPTVTGSH